MFHVIINPASRSGKGIQIWKEQIEPELLRRKISYMSYFSQAAGAAAGLARQIVEEHPQEKLTLIILGGDGTMNEILQELPSFDRLTFGYIPTGSSNDLARDLGIPFNPVKALELILSGKEPHRMDIGQVQYDDQTTRLFAVSCGIGYDAAVCEEALHSRLKNVLNRLGLGKLTYLGIALKKLIQAKEISGELLLDDGETIHLDSMLFTACMIHRYEGGGFKFCPDAVDNDGIMNLCVAGDLPKLKILFALPTAFQGNHYRFKGITAYTARKVTITASAPLWVHTDGEVKTQATRITISTKGQLAIYTESAS